MTARDPGRVGRGVDRQNGRTAGTNSGAPRSAAVAEAAEIYARVRYGLGIRPDDVARLEAAAAQAYRDSRRGMSEWDRVRCWWRKDEV